MKRNIARVAFWVLFFIELFFASVVIGAFFEGASDVNFGSISVLLILALIFAAATIPLYRIYDPFREKYYFAHETPLRYHKFFCYVSLPLGMIVTIRTLFDILSAADFPSNSFYFIDLAYSLLSLTLSCTCIIGLRKFKAYAWHALMVNYLLGTLYLFTAVIIRIIYTPFLVSSSLVPLMGYIYISAMICLYYYKRKNLFVMSDPAIRAASSSSFFVGSSPISETAPIPAAVIGKDGDLRKVEQGSYVAPTPPVSHPMQYFGPVNQALSPSAPKVQFCRKCGFKLLEGSKFCSCCGTAIVEEIKNVLP